MKKVCKTDRSSICDRNFRSVYRRCSQCGGDNGKAGFIFLHDENSTYDLNFINAAKAACEKINEYVAEDRNPGGPGSI